MCVKTAEKLDRNHLPGTTKRMDGNLDMVDVEKAKCIPLCPS